MFSRRGSGAGAAEGDSAGDGALVHTPEAPFMQGVNLLPSDLLPDDRKIRWSPAHIALGALIPLALVGMAMLYFSASSDADAAKTERDQTAQQVETVQLQLAQEAQARGLTALASAGGQQLATAVEGGLTARLAWDRVIDNVSRVMPDGLWLRSAVAASSTDGDSAGGSTLRIDGTSIAGHEEIAQYAARLATLRDIDTATLESVATTDVNEQEVLEFTITTTVKGPR